MTEIEFVSHPTVKLIDTMGSDLSVIQAARVSTSGENVPEDDEGKGLINYLVKHRHGSPLEHTSLKFFVEAPIFVIREFQRHRIASYNEVSGRYKELEPRFWIPSRDRKMFNTGTSARPEMSAAPEWVNTEVEGSIRSTSRKAWSEYRRLIDLGVANEVARSVLPLNLMTSMYVTMNARSLMNFLSLRTHNPDATAVSYPQREIEEVAEVMEQFFAARFPWTYEAFTKNGRVAP